MKRLHLKFDADGKVQYHRDYWDTGEELYMKAPALGTLMRGLKGAGGVDLTWYWITVAGWLFEWKVCGQPEKWRKSVAID